MTFPAFYHPKKVGTLYRPDTQSAIDEGAATEVRPSSEDKTRTLLLLVDAQVDFIHEDGALSVPGAIDDTRRTIEFLFNHIEDITSIAASLDSHIPLQIFYPMWWVNADRQHPDPYTLISKEDIESGKWVPTVEADWSRYYVRKLQDDARKLLTIWPYHTMLGTPGHSITPALYEAIAYHSAARDSQPRFLAKGMIPKTEHYSILEPEVKVPDEPQGILNTDFMSMIGQYDRVLIAGQAKSHCVLETTHSMVTYYGEANPALLKKWYVLSDAMSSVVHPEIDFETLANEQYAEFEKKGLNMVTTRDLA